VIGVEPAGAAKLSRARAAGAPVRLEATGSMADGLLATQIGSVPFAHHAAYIDEVVTVDDSELAPAMRYLLDRLKIVAEPSGAITIAALQSGRVEPRGKTVAVLSGGNIEYDGLRSVLGNG
jgi:threonine dehydratase